MSNPFFRFKEFVVHQEGAAMKVTTDACLFGAWAAHDISMQKKINHVLDIGAGTGLLSLMLAQKTYAPIRGIELDPTAALEAKANVKASPWKDNIEIIQGDVKEFLAESGTRYDIIISNPPFYEKEIISPDDKKNMAHHGSTLVLDELFDLVKSNLSPEGKFYLLLPYKRFFTTLALIQKKQLGIFQLTLVRQSLTHGHFRVMIIGTHAAYSPPTMTRDEISIRDEHGEYTPAFTDLLKDYYLYL